MALLSRSARIWLVLCLNALLFFVEVTVGYAVGSLALIADSFHMLADVLSLVVALTAIKVGARPADDRYNYGWARAEIVAALVNGVFLCALCLTIFLEALGRLVSVEEISDPKLVVIVGVLGLTLNIVGLFLFHEHGHSHGAGACAHSHSPAHPAPLAVPSAIHLPLTPFAPCAPAAHGCAHADDDAEKDLERGLNSDGDADSESADADASSSLVEALPLLDSEMHHRPHTHSHAHDHHGHGHGHAHAHHHHHHAHGHGHDHGSMNMRALLLHVAGDALGNLGVIASGLVIWLSPSPWRFYLDPAVSLLLSVLVSLSATGLVRSAATVLLQQVPDTVDVSRVREEAGAVEGVRSVQSVRVWQLDERTVVGEVKVVVQRGAERRWESIKEEVRSRMKSCGVDQVVVEPEFEGEEAEEVDEFIGADRSQQRIVR